MRWSTMAGWPKRSWSAREAVSLARLALDTAVADEHWLAREQALVRDALLDAKVYGPCVAAPEPRAAMVPGGRQLGVDHAEQAAASGAQAGYI